MTRPKYRRTFLPWLVVFACFAIHPSPMYAADGDASNETGTPAAATEGDERAAAGAWARLQDATDPDIVAIRRVLEVLIQDRRRTVVPASIPSVRGGATEVRSLESRIRRLESEIQYLRNRVDRLR